MQPMPFDLVGLPNGVFVRCCQVDDQDLRQPFYSQAIRAAQQRGAEESLLAMDQLALPSQSEPDLWIAHVSRCGSTLVSQMLTADEGNRVISEPSIMGQVLLALDQPLERRREWMKRIVHALVGPSEDRRQVIKLQSWFLHFGEVMEFLQEKPGIVVFRDPLEILVSLMEKPTAWMNDAGLNEILRDIDGAPKDAGPEEWLAWQIGETMRRAAWLAGPRVRFVDYTTLPDRLFDCVEIDAEERKRMLQVAQRPAKSTKAGEIFTSDSNAKRGRATPGQVQAIDRYSREAFEALKALAEN